jgi:hypothetical protein
MRDKRVNKRTAYRFLSCRVKRTDTIAMPELCTP